MLLAYLLRKRYCVVCVRAMRWPWSKTADDVAFLSTELECLQDALSELAQGLHGLKASEAAREAVAAEQMDSLRDLLNKLRMVDVREGRNGKEHHLSTVGASQRERAIQNAADIAAIRASRGY